jgi:hypothetical protein
MRVFRRLGGSRDLVGSPRRGVFRTAADVRFGFDDIRFRQSV